MKKIIFISSIIFFIFAIFVFGINIYVKKSVPLPVSEWSEKFNADCILVLGCGVKNDGTPSDMLYDRIRKGVELYKKGAAPKILMSGDHGRKNYDEVNVMREYAVKMGVPVEDIFMDHAGFSTYDSILRAKKIFCCERIIIVSQEYHLYRALFIAGKFDIAAIGVSADYHIYYGQFKRDIREILARVKEFFQCIIKPEPKFLGDAIPVSGDGRVTEG